MSEPLVVELDAQTPWREQWRALRAQHAGKALLCWRCAPVPIGAEALARLWKASADLQAIVTPIPAAWLGTGVGLDTLDDAAFARSLPGGIPIDVDPSLLIAAAEASEQLLLCDHAVVDLPAPACPAPIASWLAPISASPLPHAQAARDQRPVVLHLLHGWGGGAARYVRDLAGADTARTHLVLHSVSADDGRRHGVALRLCDAANGAVLREQAMLPAIDGVALAHPEYRAWLQTIVEQFDVEQIWVSSLVGHALDALDIAPILRWIVHDALPFWPGLDHDFHHATLDFDDRAALDAALAAPGPFRGQSATHWIELRRETTRRLLARQAHIVAPTNAALAQLLRLSPTLASLPRQIVGHGLAPLQRTPFDPDSQPRGKLRLCTIGRLQGGKGEAFLDSFLPRLLVHADVYLIGAGKAAHRFFGQRGVHILLDYQRDALPAIVARIEPHAALFPGTVSETFSYALSEAQALGLPVLANRIGAFAERVDNDVGLLLDAKPEAWIAAIARLDRDRAALAAWRAELQTRNPRSLSQMLDDYQSLLPSGERRRHRYRLRRWCAALSERLMADHARRSAEAQRDALLRECKAQRAELAERGAWGFALQRQLDERTRWSLRLREELDAQRALKESAERDLRLSEHEHRARHMLIEARLYEAQGELKRAQDNFTNQSRMLNQDLSQLRQAHEALRAENQRLASIETQLCAERDRLLGIRKTLEHDRQVLLDQRDELLSSTSWRLTAPIRALGQRWRTLRATLQFRFARAKSAWQRFKGSLARRGLKPTLARAARELKEMQRVAPSAPTFAPPAVDPDFKPFALPVAETPLASIVIPVYGQLHFTWNALKALTSAAATPFEVIVVDDASPDDSAERLAAVEGLRVVRNEKNLGFIGACNAGAAQARGRYLVFLNNDTSAQPGWLDALVARAEQPGVGLVGAKLIYPDGRLQEAGGVVFDDGSGWNYGRFEHPDDPRFDYPREVDYCSGAAILIGKSLFDELGGFDAHYAPAYYEDTDLAFKVRARGLKVIYEPTARVVHYEGISSGTDLNHGTKRFQTINQSKFRERWATALAQQPAPVDRDKIAAAAHHRARGHVLLIDANTPEPDQDSGSVRYVNLIAAFQALGWRVSFFPDNRAYLPGYTERLRALGVEVLFHPWLSDPVAFFRERGAEFDAVMVSRHYVARHYLTLVREHAPQARLIFDTVDLHFLREQRAAEIARSEALERSADATRAVELEVIRKSDVTIVVSSYEQQVLAPLVPDATVELLSNIHDVVGCRAPFAARKDFWFIGGFQHQPNVDAMLWFVQEVWPQIRQRLPEALFHIVGSKMPDAIAALAGNGVIAHGFIDNVERFLDGCRVAVAPLRFGAGVKGKVNQSMAYGQPVVATALAVEGMAIEHEREALVADEAHAFAVEAVRLYSDEALWNRLSRNALDNIEAHFSSRAAQAALLKILS